MSKKILIIDDESDVMKMVVYRLKVKGYEIFTASNGKEGIETAVMQKPSLIILDYRLPDFKAKEVIRRIHANEETKCAPVILITASTESIGEKAKECGAIDYIPKPIEPEELYAQVEKYILK